MRLSFLSLKKPISILMAAFLASVSVGAMAAAHGGAMKDINCKMDEKKLVAKTKAACNKMTDEKKGPN